MKSWLRILRERLVTFPEVVLGVATLWVTFLPLLYWMLFEPPTYRAAMWPGALLVAGGLMVLGWLHPVLFLLLALPVGLLDAIYAHVGHFWRIGDLALRVETALDTSPGESSEFLQRFVLHSKFAWALMGYVFLGLALGGLYWVLRRRAPRRPRAWYHWGAGLLVLAALVGLGVVWARPYPAVNLTVTTYQVYERLGRILARKKYVAQALHEQPRLDCQASYDKIVFVLGESANRDYMHAYGYDLPTTPFLDGLPNKVLVRAIAPANQTMSAVPILLTPATVHDYEPFYTSPSVLTDLRRCGYETFWLSNQLRYSPYTSSVSSIASEADVVRFVLNELHTTFGLPDEVLFQIFDPSEVVPGRKQAFFFHLLGSHFDWKERYPPDKALIAHPQDLYETYANTIYYTDQVLQEIFQLFHERSQNMLFIYVSDHGEWITATTGGHASAHPFQEEYRVPLVFWTTHAEDLTPIAQAAQDRLVNTENLDRQIRFLLGLETDPGLSFSTQVLSLGPGRVLDYLSLPYQDHPDRP